MKKQILGNTLIFLFSFLYALWIGNFLHFLPPWIFDTGKLPSWALGPF